jgi:hypothetical protein
LYIIKVLKLKKPNVNDVRGRVWGQRFPGDGNWNNWGGTIIYAVWVLLFMDGRKNLGMKD